MTTNEMHTFVKSARSHWPTELGFFIVLVILVGASAYGYLRLSALSAHVADLDMRLASTTAFLNAATTSLADALNQDRQHLQDQLGNINDQVDSVSGTVSDLQKLSKIDPQLLAKYSKVYFLSDTYAPERLTAIPTIYDYRDSVTLQIIPEVLPELTRMLDRAKEDGVDIYVESAYRSFAEQKNLKSQYNVVYGAGTANQFSADQGYSEHQLGTTVDLITTGTNGQLDGFDKTPAYAWLTKYAYKYGFVLSYPPGNSYYIYEPWHWRFVGTDLARHLHNSETYFYQMDQREIDSYLIHLFD
jgi:D-alanyl-D-alanine carboxypeptidase